MIRKVFLHTSKQDVQGRILCKICEQLLSLTQIISDKFMHVRMLVNGSKYILFYILQAAEADNTITGARGPHGEGYYDYQANKFVMEDGRLGEMTIRLALDNFFFIYFSRVKIVVNQDHRARG
jgi:hypothetical protein